MYILMQVKALLHLRNFSCNFSYNFVAIQVKQMINELVLQHFRPRKRGTI